MLSDFIWCLWSLGAKECGVEDTLGLDGGFEDCVVGSPILLFFCDQAARGGWVSSRQGLGVGSWVNCRATGRIVPGFKACLE